jgi:hypothetical protein
MLPAFLEGEEKAWREAGLTIAAFEKGGVDCYLSATVLSTLSLSL